MRNAILHYSPEPRARRSAALAALLLSAALGAFPCSAREGRAQHALAMHGEPKYGPGFTHFDYVNPHAPKGGTMRRAEIGTFDSFHPFIPKGNAAVGSSIETLMVGSADEAFTMYGLIAESVEVPDDRSWVIFTLRPEARWHDGKPITVADVVWSFETLIERGHPRYRFYYASVDKVEDLGGRRVKFSFKERGNRELPLIVGQLPVLPKHYWEAPAHDFDRTTLEPPLGSGPYRVSKFEAGRFVLLERVEDYWGKALPVNRGRYNFDRIRYDYYRDEAVIRQAIKGGAIDFRRENQAKAWALDYDVPPVRKGWLNKEAVPHQRPSGMQGFVMNSRRALFKDWRVRRALAYAFDFEWTNTNLFFGQYTRTQSYFSNSELAATGLPRGEELEILERYRAALPAAVFTTPYEAPATDASGWPRENLRKAFALLAQAGWEVRDGALVHTATGRPMRFEFLLVAQDFKRIVLPYARNLKRLGIEVGVRVVDSSQYINRLRQFDFDMIVGGWGQSNSPGNEQRNYWSSAAADSRAARNFAGIRAPVIDALIESLIKAPTRQSLVARTRALDRVLLHGHYVVPNWHLRADRFLFWDKFSRPQVTPADGTAIDLWWYDAEKAARLEKARGSGYSSADRDAGAPAIPTVIAVTAGLLLLGYIALRRVKKSSPRGSP